jgi:O-antigen/teichoic acid export membrane protein
MAYLYGVGRPGAASTGQGLGLAVVVVLGAILIPRHGAVGAAIATSISFVATTAALLAWFQHVRKTVSREPAAAPSPEPAAETDREPDREPADDPAPHSKG